MTLKRLTHDQRIEARAIDLAVADFIAAIRHLWPDVDVDLCFEQLCSLGGHPPVASYDAQAKRAVLAELVNGRAPGNLFGIIARHAKLANRRRKKKEAKANPPMPTPRPVPDPGMTFVGPIEHALVLAALPESHFNKLTEWRSLRSHVLLRCKGRCEMCGASREQVRLDVRHTLPRFYAPERAFDPGNVRALCPACRADGGWTRQVQWGGRK